MPAPVSGPATVSPTGRVGYLLERPAGWSLARSRLAGSRWPDEGEGWLMGAVIGPIVAAVVGAVLAGGAAFGVISSQTAVPATVDAPYVVYGSTN